MTDKHNHDEPLSEAAMRCSSFNEGYAYAVERMQQDSAYAAEVLSQTPPMMRVLAAYLDYNKEIS